MKIPELSNWDGSYLRIDLKYVYSISHVEFVLGLISRSDFHLFVINVI